jgi:hypothetical protein
VVEHLICKPEALSLHNSLIFKKRKKLTEIILSRSDGVRENYEEDKSNQGTL